MNVEKIMEKLKKDRVWASTNQDAPKLEPCVFCGGEGRIVAHNPMFGLSGAWVRCRSCGACGPKASIYAMINTPLGISSPMLPESLERGIDGAVDAWNSRTVDRSRMVNMKVEVEVEVEA